MDECAGQPQELSDVYQSFLCCFTRALMATPFPNQPWLCQCSYSIVMSAAPEGYSDDVQRSC